MSSRRPTSLSCASLVGRHSRRCLRRDACKGVTSSKTRGWRHRRSTTRTPPHSKRTSSRRSSCVSNSSDRESSLCSSSSTCSDLAAEPPRRHRLPTQPRPRLRTTQSLQPRQARRCCHLAQTTRHQQQRPFSKVLRELRLNRRKEGPRTARHRSATTRRSRSRRLAGARRSEHGPMDQRRQRKSARWARRTCQPPSTRTRSLQARGTAQAQVRRWATAEATRGTCRHPTSRRPHRRRTRAWTSE